MLDLQKYLRRAEADPSFRKRLLQDANRAIKDEFDEDLPYALKCKERLSFEVESMDGYNDEDLKGVAGGSPLPGSGEQTIPPGYVHIDEFDYPITATERPCHITYKDDNGSHHVHDIKEINGVKYVNTKNSYVNDEYLKGVAGGSMVPPGSKGLVRRKYNFNFDPNYEVTPTGNNVNFIHGDNMDGRLKRAKRLLNSGSNNS